MTIPLRKNIVEMAGYVPGFQPEDADQWIKLNTNENPYPPSPKVLEAIQKELGGDGASLRQYPDAASRAARQAAADLYGFDVDWLIMANGSDELLNNLIRAFADEGDEVAFVQPSYSYYGTLIDIQGATIRTFSLTDQFKLADFPERYQGKLFFLTSPNAPLGVSFSLAEIEDIAQRCDGMLVVDEAYADFASETALPLVKKYKNVIVTRTFSKSYALAGMRLGLAVAHPQVVAALDKIRDHYHLDRLALVAAEAALKDQGYLQQRLEQICTTRQWFSQQLRELGFSVPPSQTNFVFACPADGDGQRVFELLKQHKILVRHFSDPLLKHGLRISIGTREEMEAILNVLGAEC
ncbi:MAG: histidinol-phosphate transaminase [Desulfobacteraceae bacterium 4572_35.2]|nr:MAG: histidinol-phosphate transaminase [Desulfobacteraceae bacterium 4572_35.2]